MHRQIHRQIRCSAITIAVALTFLYLLCVTLLPTGVVQAARLKSPVAQADGQVYIIQAGDSLYQIAGEFYGNGALWEVIAAATNAKAQQDSSFTPIGDPKQLRIGQKIWIPNQPTRSTVGKASAAQTTTASIPSVRFASPANGAIVAPTFEVVMAAKGVKAEPAGTVHANSGHMHILVDEDFVDPGEVIINDESHLHFGKGQLTTTLTLRPGKHVLRLQFSDGAHMALNDPNLRDSITVTAAEANSKSQVRGVYFASPASGAVVSSPFTVVMAANGVTVEAAGKVRENAGHMHILVDDDFVPAGEVIVNDATHLHFGKGQLTTTVTLDPGIHTLRLQLADGAHMALAEPALQATITVTVVQGGHEAAATGVHFVSPVDGATVSSTFAVVMAASGVKVEPAGEIHENAGHLHILVDEDFVPAGEVLINDATHLHFGKGQLTTTLTLTAGIHVLGLQLANGAHMALDDPRLQDSITITVK
jgi:hypothetical protein